MAVENVYEFHIECSHTQAMWVPLLPQLTVKKLKEKPSSLMFFSKTVELFHEALFFFFCFVELCWVLCLLCYVNSKVLPGVEEPSCSILDTLSHYLYIRETSLVVLVTFVGKRTCITR